MPPRITIHQLSFIHHSLTRNTALTLFSVGHNSTWISFLIATNKIMHLYSSDLFYLKSFSETETEVFRLQEWKLETPLRVQRLCLQNIDESYS